MRNFGRLWLTATGIGAAITLLFPSVVILAAITIIGIPIALALMVAPLVFIVSLGAWFIGSRLRFGIAGYAIGAAAVLLALAVPPSIINAGLEERAAAFIADDRDALGKPVRAKVIAVRSSETRFGRGETACDGFCMRALMNGVAERVLVIQRDANEPLDPAMAARSFRMEKRIECPAVVLSGGHDEIKEKTAKRGFGRKRAHELMQLEIAKGNCLIEETAQVGDADVVLSRGTVHRGKSVIAAGLDPAADTVTAKRLSVHARVNGDFRETYRRTSVVTHLLLPVLAPTAEGAAELRAHAVLARYTARRNLDSVYESEPDWSGFLTQTLGLDLALRDTGAADDMRQVLRQQIDNKSAPTAAARDVGANFFDGLSSRHKMTAEDFQLAQSLLTDPRFSVPRGAAAAVRFADGAGDDYFDAIGAAMFERLRTIAANDDGAPYPRWRDEAQYIASVVRALPAATILKHRSDLDWLAKQERVRVHAYIALVRLQEFGADASPTLLWLIDEAVRLKDKYGTDWNNAYLAGLDGLCLMGEAGKAMIRPIYQRLASGAMVKHASNWELTIHTLTGMGADPDEMWQYLQTSDRNHTRKRFDREVERARTDRDCRY